MARSVVGPEIEKLIQLLARLPGLGPRSARRAALALLKKKEPLMQPLAKAMADAAAAVSVCSDLRQRRYAEPLHDLPRSRSRPLGPGGG